LRSRGVMVSARGAAGVWGIRASVHFPNREEDVEALGEALRGLRGLNLAVMGSVLDLTFKGAVHDLASCCKEPPQVGKLKGL